MTKLVTRRDVLCGAAALTCSSLWIPPSARGATIGARKSNLTLTAGAGGGSEGLRSEYEDMITDGATVRVVDFDSGNDANPGTEASPWLNFYYGIENLPAGDILLVRGTSPQVNSTWQGGGSNDFDQSLLRPANSGISAARPSVIANWPGSNPVIVHSPVASAPNGILFGTEQRSHIIVDGLTFDKDNYGGSIAAVGDGSVGVIYRHCTLQNLDNTGSGSNRAALIMLASNSRRDAIVEYMLIQGMIGDGSNNTAGILTYDNHGGIIRGCDVDGDDLYAAIFIKVQGKLELYAVNEQAYRNICRGGNLLLSLSSSEDNNTNGAKLFENLVLDANVVWGSRTPDNPSIYYSRSTEVEIRAHTVINGTFFGAYSNEDSTFGEDSGSTADTRVSDLVCKNNLAVVSGNAVSLRHDNNYGSFPHGEWNASGSPDYNGWVIAGGSANFNAFYRDVGPGPDYNEDWSEWQAHGYDANSVIATSAGFVNQGADDYRLDPSSAFYEAGDAGQDMGAFWEENWYPQTGPSPMS